MERRSTPGRTEKARAGEAVSGRPRPRKGRSGNGRQKTPTRAGKLLDGAADDDENSKGHLTYSDKSSYKLQSTFYAAKEHFEEHGEAIMASGKEGKMKAQQKLGRETEQRAARADEKPSSVPKSPEFFESTK